MTTRPPFAWQDKRVLRRIREQIEDYGSALAVYGALTVAASDREAEEFQTTHAWLAQASGFGERTVRSRLAELVRIGAVHVTTPALRGPCTYRLLAFGNDCQSNGNGCRAFGKVSALPLPGSECTEVKKDHGNGCRTGGAKSKLTDVQRIGIEKQLAQKRAEEKTLSQDTSEDWQRRVYPERVKDRERVKGEIKHLEDLLRA